MQIRLSFVAVLFAFLTFAGVSESSAQGEQSGPSDSEATKPAGDRQTGIALPNTDRLRVRLRFMVGYGLDESQASLGVEKQGRVGYAVVELFGKLSDRVRYVVEVNPVNETQPLPACGEEHYFFPNTPQAFGPNVACDNNGRVRVDDYRFLALDPLAQQGPIRQAYITFQAGGFGITGGRFVQRIGFGWEESGSFTAKDATHIQRINTEASFGVRFSYERIIRGRRLFSVSGAGVLGDGNRFRDYDYFYALDQSLDTNSWPTMILSGTAHPLEGLEFRGAYKKGESGSKVERFPNFYASKRNDNSLVLSARYRPVQHVTVFGESAHYTWGLYPSSAEMLGMDTEPVRKNGYYVGGNFNYPLTNAIRVGATITREELSRDDALIKYLASRNLYGVSLGKKERGTVFRFYAEFSSSVTIGFYRNSVSNPFPWVSGITPVAGPRAFDPGRGSDKWGAVVRFTLQ